MDRARREGLRTPLLVGLVKVTGHGTLAESVASTRIALTLAAKENIRQKSQFLLCVRLFRISRNLDKRFAILSVGLAQRELLLLSSEENSSGLNATRNGLTYRAAA